MRKMKEETVPMATAMTIALGALTAAFGISSTWSQWMRDGEAKYRRSCDTPGAIRHHKPSNQKRTENRWDQAYQEERDDRGFNPVRACNKPRIHATPLFPKEDVRFGSRMEGYKIGDPQPVLLIKPPNTNDPL
jgi:hypothetical protein